MRSGAGLPHQPDRAGSDPVPFRLRASCLPLLWPGLDRVCRARAHHRAFQADACRPAVRPSLSMQERLGRQVINALDGILAAHGVAVYLDAGHLCMQMRGVREQEATTRTTFWRGAYESDQQLRDEFLKLCTTGAHP